MIIRLINKMLRLVRHDGKVFYEKVEYLEVNTNASDDSTFSLKLPHTQGENPKCSYFREVEVIS